MHPGWLWLVGLLTAALVAGGVAWSSTDHFTAQETELLKQVKADPEAAAYIRDNDVPDSYLVYLGHFGCDYTEDIDVTGQRLDDDLTAHHVGDAEGFHVGLMTMSLGTDIICPPPE